MPEYRPDEEMFGCPNCGHCDCTCGPTPRPRPSFTDEQILNAAEKALGRKPDRISGRSKNNVEVRFCWKPDRTLDPLNFSDWYYLSDLGLY